MSQQPKTRYYATLYIPLYADTHEKAVEKARNMAASSLFDGATLVGLERKPFGELTGTEIDIHAYPHKL